MVVRGEGVTLNSLREWLEERGVHFPRGGKHPSIMRLWLEKAGIFTGGSWRVDEGRLAAVLGAEIDEVEGLAALTVQQKAYLKTLANMGGSGPYQSNEVEKLATTTYGVKFDEKNLPKTVLYPLEEAGYITLTRGTKAPGRGAKPFLVAATSRVARDLITPLLEALDKQIAPELRPLLRKSLQEILAELKSAGRHARGLALEALAFYLMRLVDLRYVATRLRGAATGGAEVDLIFEGSRLLFSRWQIRCKNAPSVAVDEVAKQVGVLNYFSSDVGVVVSTGTFDSSAVRFAEMVRRRIRQPLILIDRSDLDAIAQHPSTIVDIVERQARPALLAA